jgi:hypothetical protein
MTKENLKNKRDKMSKILDPTAHPMDETEFFAHEGAYILRNGNQITLTRAELEGLYRFTQAIKAEELIAAGWVYDGYTWNKPSRRTIYQLEGAWNKMQREAQNAQ